MIIVCGETRDIRRKETNKGQRCFKQLEMKTSSTNVIITDAPHHHDLEENLCINKEVIIFSRKLQNAMKSFQHVQLLNMKMSRNRMRHGSHMNSGKSWTSNIVVKLVSALSSTK